MADSPLRETVFTIEEACAEVRITKTAHESTKKLVDKEIEDENPQCTVMLWEQYLEQPTVLHRAFALPDTDKYVLDLSGGRNGKRDIELTVKTEDDMARLKDDLLRRLILLKGNITYERIKTVGEYKGSPRHQRETWRDELAVLINTGHPEVHRQIEDLLQKGTWAIQQNKRFCYEISFGADVCTWYGWRVDRDRRKNYYPTTRIAKSKHLTIFIHNSSVPVRFFMNKAVIICCCPCWLMSCGLCYFIFRNHRVTDIKKKINTKVTARHTDLQVGESTPCCGCGTIYHMQAWECSDWDGIELI